MQLFYIVLESPKTTMDQDIVDWIKKVSERNIYFGNSLLKY